MKTYSPTLSTSLRALAVNALDRDTQDKLHALATQAHELARENAALDALADANCIARCDAQDRADKLAALLELAANSDVTGLPRDPVSNLPFRAAVRAVLQSAKE